MYNPHLDSLSTLAEIAVALLRIRATLAGSLDPYLSSADVALAEVLEITSGIATEITVALNDDDDLTIKLPVEPLCYTEAVEKLPAFLAIVKQAYQSQSTTSSVDMCAIGARAFTFSFHFRSREESEPE